MNTHPPHIYCTSIAAFIGKLCCCNSLYVLNHLHNLLFYEAIIIVDHHLIDRMLHIFSNVLQYTTYSSQLQLYKMKYPAHLICLGDQ